MPRTMERIVTLNVGGKTFMTRVGTLCAEPDSMLARWFDPDSHFARPAEIDGCVFIDRDPDMFTHILNYLRGNCNHVSKMGECDLVLLKGEADYFSLDSLVDEIDKHFRWKALSVLKPGQWRCENCRTLNEAKPWNLSYRDARKCCACEVDKPDDNPPSEGIRRELDWLDSLDRDRRLAGAHT